MNGELTNWQSKRFTEMKDSEQNIATSNIIRVTNDIITLYTGCTERAIKLLVLLNSGGIITLLAYIFHASNFTSNFLLNLSLITFVIGLFLILDVVARDYDYMLSKTLEFNDDIQNFLLGNIQFDHIKRFSISQQKNFSMCTVILGRLSAYCVVIGVSLGVVGYLFS